MGQSRWKQWPLFFAAAMTATLLILTVASGWFEFIVKCTPRGELCVGISAGSIVIGGVDVPGGVGVYWERYRLPQWLFLPGTFYSAAAIPLWIPALLSGAATLVVWQDFKRALPGCCPTCGYDTATLPTTTTPCPECGKIATPAAPMPEVPDATLWPRRPRK